MCDVPLDLQRKFEQRWAARFARPTPSSAAPQGHQPASQNQQLAVPPEAIFQILRNHGETDRAHPLYLGVVEFVV
jgi:hypothetical protein